MFFWAEHFVELRLGGIWCHRCTLSVLAWTASIILLYKLVRSGGPFQRLAETDHPAQQQLVA